MTNKTALIMAGGTGGHIFPGLALAEQLIENGWQVEWLGTADRMEAELVPKHDIPIHFIEIKGIRGNGLARKLALPITLVRAFKQARRVLKKIKPAIVVGFGGYVSGPGGLAAKSLGIPLLVHEQNAVLGMTNRWLSKLAYHTFLAFDLFGGKHPKTSSVVGNPVRRDIVELGTLAKRRLSAETDELRVLIIGGSLGARVFNRQLADIFAKVDDRRKLSVRHQCGKNNRAEVEQAYLQKGVNPEKVEVKVDEFIDDMTSALKWCDLVICRAGALTVSELAASGNVGIFVPLPHAVDDHQTANARWLVDHNAGVLVPQTQFEQLVQTINEFAKNPEKLNKLQHNASLVGRNDAVNELFALCQKLEMKH